MNRTIRALLVEDSQADAELVVAEIERAGYEARFSQVDNQSDLRQALEKQEWDCIVADHRMPGFTSLDALALLQQSGKDIPFLIVSGVIGEEHAVEAMRLGAHDYIMKHNLKRLVAAIEREIREAGTRREKRDSEARLKDSEARFRTMSEAAPVMIWTTGPDQKFDYFNRRWLEFTGLTLEKAKGEGWLEKVHPEDRPSALAVLGRAFERHEEFTMEHRLKRRDGQDRWLRCAGAPRVSDGEFLGFIGSCVDITDFMRNIKARDEFLSIVSHELRTPLTTLSLHLESTLRQAREDRHSLALPESADRLEISYGQARRLSLLVDSLLEIARVPQSRDQLKLGEWDLVAIADRACGRVRSESPGCRLEVAPGTAPPILGFWDREKLEQMLTHLLSNAVKFGAGKPIELRLGREGESAVLEVKDQGIGISDSDLERIFDRFERAVSSRHFSGFGVGLTIVKQIVEAHGGIVEVRSVPEQGSVFRVVLPLRPACEEKSSEPRLS